MHFFYLDETGCNGADLNTAQEPIFVLGGISVKDQGWVKTTEEMETIISEYFSPNSVPTDFELHAHELLSPNGDGPFTGHSREVRNNLAFSLLDMIDGRSHQIHFIALDKQKIDDYANDDDHQAYQARIPYLIGFDYIITHVNHYVRNKLGHTARGIIILDKKDIFESEIADITRFRRFEIAKTNRIKWLVEFSYSIDSEKHPMIQMSDLAIYCIKKFLEMDQGHRENWPDTAKTFYAQCFEKVYKRVPQKPLVEQKGRHAKKTEALLGTIAVRPRRAWKRHYGI